MKGVADTLNRGMLLDPEFHVLGNKTDLFISHIMFTQNVIILWKIKEDEWKAAAVRENHIDSYGFAGPSFYDLSRSEYTKWKTQVSWEIAGMQRP